MGLDIFNMHLQTGFQIVLFANLFGGCFFQSK